MSYLTQVFEEFTEIPAFTWIAIVLLLAFGVLLAIFTPKVKWNARMLASAALCIAISFVLSYIRLLHMPQGGSITPASMLPVMIFCFAYGFGPGLICTLAYGLLQMFQDPYLVGFIQIMLDYFLAFGALSLVALFRPWKHPFSFSVGVLVAGTVRMVLHIISGVVFFAAYAEGSGHGVFAYSLLYNLTSVGMDALICAVLAFLPPVRRLVNTLSASRRMAKTA